MAEQVVPVFLDSDSFRIERHLPAPEDVFMSNLSRCDSPIMEAIKDESNKYPNNKQHRGKEEIKPEVHEHGESAERPKDIIPNPHNRKQERDDNNRGDGQGGT